MNSFVVYESLAVGLKEGLKVCIVWLVFYSYLALKDKKFLIKPFYAGILFSFLISAAAFLLQRPAAVKEYLANFIEMSFAVFLVSSAAALMHVSGMNLLWGRKRSENVSEGMRSASKVVVFLVTVLFFAPDNAGSILFLRDISLMKENAPATYMSALGGLLISAAAVFILARLSSLRRIGSFFDIPQLLLFLAIVKLLGSGIKGFAEISLIPSVQRGFMKFSHDFIHQTFVLIMVPDHPLLKTTVWNFIGFFFGSNFAGMVSLFILLFPPLMFIYFSLFRHMPEPEGRTGAERRKLKSVLLSDRRRKALPAAIFICFILAAWFLQTGESVSRLYNPKPKPVVEDKGIVMIPVNDPTMDLMDGVIHKFSLSHQGEEIRLLIIRKQNQALSVCLDACEICPPAGYGQREDRVFCIYCNTPIPINTLGEPGGCNPIPLESVVDDRFVRIEVNEILKKWEYVKTGKGREAIRQ